MTTDSARLQQSVAHCIEALRIPGAAVAIHAGDFQAQACAGHANTRTGLHVDPCTAFEIGSITKIFTATLMLRLAEQGKVDLEGPVQQYLPSLRIGDAQTPAALTVRSLLDYSSGIEGDLFFDAGTDTDALARYVDACAQLGFVHFPGTMRSYCSTAYAIAGRIIEVVTGRTFDDALRELVLEPIGLERYSIAGVGPASAAAVGHTWNPASGRFEPVLSKLPYALGPAGSTLSMSASDLLRFGLLHARDGRLTDGDRYLSTDSVRGMRSATRIVPPDASPLLIGWGVLESTAGPLAVASGATIAQNSFLLVVPEADFVLAVLANTPGGAERLFMELGRSVLKEWTGVTVSLPPAPPANLSREQGLPAGVDASSLTGEYRNSLCCRVTFDDDRLRLEVAGSSVAGHAAVRQTGTLIALPHPDKFAVWLDGADAPHMTVGFVRRGGPGTAVTHLSMSRRLYLKH